MDYESGGAKEAGATKAAKDTQEIGATEETRDAQEAGATKETRDTQEAGATEETREACQVAGEETILSEKERERAFPVETGFEDDVVLGALYSGGGQRHPFSGEYAFRRNGDHLFAIPAFSEEPTDPERGDC